MSTSAETQSSPHQHLQQNAQLWQIDLRPAPGQPDRMAAEKLASAHDLQLSSSLRIQSSRGFLLQGNLDQSTINKIAVDLLAEPVVETYQIGRPGDPQFRLTLSNNEIDIAAARNLVAESPSHASPSSPPPIDPGHFDGRQVYVLPLPGVTDAVAETTLMAIRDMGIEVDAVRTYRRFRIDSLPANEFSRLQDKLLSNSSVEMVVLGDLEINELLVGQSYRFDLKQIPLGNLSDEQLVDISKQWQLSLSLVEMQTIAKHFQTLQREPTDIELESIAQTWSEHCSHKTLAGRINYDDGQQKRSFENMLKETIFAATMSLRQQWGDDDWCVSVFKDNAGIVRFDDDHNIAFKVETHNRPSALEPYGGANTGIGGVIRDTLGTGMGAKPICNTDVFCFAPPDTPFDQLPPGVMHPRLIMKGVVAGVRDYGNRMGIPTVNGAVYFDPRYVGNPLVFCGNVGLIPHDQSFKQPQPNDLIVSIGGKTGRDGIHGATFSSAELTEESDITSGGAVQIGNAITEKMLMDVMLQARDLKLFNAVTDCGAGGYSSAVGEMGEEIGAEVWLDRVPLKYDGLSYTEIWISEAQERMVLAVPEENWTAFQQLCAAESVTATVIGQFKPTGKLQLKYNDQIVGDLSMAFLHGGRPPVVRDAIFRHRPEKPLVVETQTVTSTPQALAVPDLASDLLKILSSLNVASKHWIIRQYDHEVQGGSVLKPLVGVANDGPGDAAVLRPILDSQRGIVVSCGMNPHLGDVDPYHMAASAIDEAIRNCVAVGADPNRIAILDNFCWGHTDRPETLGDLVRSALACHDYSIAFGTPFISGKDSLHNEFSYTDETTGQRQTISIPPTLLISALGQIDDVRQAVSMDFKVPGNLVYQIGSTGDHMGGSHWSLIHGGTGGQVPVVDAEIALLTFRRIHQAIQEGLIRSCHDLSEGGLAVAMAEMAFAGGWGVKWSIDAIPVVAATIKQQFLEDNHPLNATSSVSNPLLLDENRTHAVCKLFSESNSRFLMEVSPSDQVKFESLLEGIPCCLLGEVTQDPWYQVSDQETILIRLPISELKSAWQSPLDFDR